MNQVSGDPSGAGTPPIRGCRALRDRLLAMVAACLLVTTLGTVLALERPTPSSAQGGGPQVTLQEVDGGLDYYADFSHSLPANESYFPIGVWFESVTSQADVDRDKAVGLNTYVVLTRSTNLSLVRNNGMKAFLYHQDWTSSPAVGNETAAWELNDEIDMEQPPDSGCTQLKQLAAGLPNDGRMSYNNFGKGVMFWESDAQASCYVNAVDLASDDIYWFTDPGNACSAGEGGELFHDGTRGLTQEECRRASNYGAVVERMRRLADYEKPIWNFVEVGHPFTENDAPTITPGQVRAAVWHSIIGGARGILYFNHSFGGPCQTQHALRDSCYADVRATVDDVNAQIQNLAPVLNSPFVASGWTHNPGTRAMVKWDGENFYVFAGSTQGAATGQFSIPCVGDATASVLGESRSRPVTDGSFTDSFAGGNAIHLYRIDGGSTCGLATRPAPNTTLGSRPANPTSSKDASFTYSSNHQGASFECRLDGQTFASCPQAGKNYTALPDGSHTFHVRAVASGTPDASPVSYTWTIDTSPPDTVIDNHPSNPSTDVNASFAYHATEPGSTFQCKLDAGAFTTCPASGRSYSGLSDGSHAFQVRAADAAGNADASPASYTWTVETPGSNPPNTTITSGPRGRTKDRRPTFRFSSDQTGIGFECKVGAKPFRACQSPFHAGRMALGKHRFQVRGVSADGPDPTPAKRTFRVVKKRRR